MGACLRAEHAVGGAAHGGRATVDDVGVDHRRGNIAVAQKLLNGADVVPVFEQVGRERVPKGVALGVLEDPGTTHRILHRALGNGFVGSVLPWLGTEAIITLALGARPST